MNYHLLFFSSYFPPSDIDNNGFLDQKDFDCMGMLCAECERASEILMNKFLFSSRNLALRATIIEGKGECHPEKLAQFQDIMRNLWTELSDLADFDKVCSNFSASFRVWQQIL